MGDYKEKMQKKLIETYNRICDFLSEKKIALAGAGIFLILLLPIVYLSFVNRASGDDYGYGTYTRAAWVASHSFIQVFQAIVRTIRQYYYGWQGTWFSIAVFSLQPEVFHKDAYVIVVFLMLFLWIGSTFLLFKEILYKRLQLDIWSYRLITTVFMVISIEFIPSTKSSIFWFNGAAHYMLPFTMCQLLTVWLLRYGDEYRRRYLIGILCVMTLLGGSNYQAALFALIIAFYVGIVNYLEKRDKHILWLLAPVITEAIGLIISMKAPGNKIRGGEEFGFSVQKVISTIGSCFAEEFQTAVAYGREKPLVYVGLFLIFLFMLEALRKRTEEKGGEERFGFQHPVIGISALICLCCAMHAPTIYAGVDFSSGVYNMNYQVFMLAFGGILLIIAKKLLELLKLPKEKLHRTITMPGILFCLLLMFFFKGNIKATTSWICLEYITSGQAADYKEQMDLQTRLLMDEDTEDVVLPFINDIQGPLMHMPVTADPDAWTNMVTREFYGKKSVVAMPRPEWNEKYGES